MAEPETRTDVSHGSSDDSSDANSDSEPVELLITGRERRKTAGNRYDRDMVTEEVEGEDDPDEVALLFATEQDEVDEEFKSEGSDEDVMSSSDDDDQGPNAGAEDLEGEKEIQKQAKADRAKKRKADLALTSKSAIRKKPKIDPTQGPQVAVAKKPSKKKERVTWMPDESAGPGRVSQRKQTVAHREETLARLKESEALSKKFKALKEKRDREKAKNAPRAMTQADRLEEAARVERRNAKSLNRWEASERKRNEEQAAKLAALKDRTLEGPVLTWRSTKGKWRGPLYTRPTIQDVTLGKEVSTEPKKRGRKPKGYHEKMAADREAALLNLTSSASHMPEQVDLVGIVPATSQQPQSNQGLQQPTSSIPLEASNGDVTDNQEPAKTQQDAMAANGDNVEMSASIIEVPTYEIQQALTPIEDAVMTDSQPAITQQPMNLDAAPLSTTNVQKAAELQQNEAQVTTELPVATSPQVHPAASQQIPEPPIIEELTTKNFVSLKNFDQLSDNLRQEYGIFYNSKKSAKPVKHIVDLCPITMQPAKYRDPATGIGYSNVVAYKILRELKEHKFVWSNMLGCYVGRDGAPVARGVPDGFPGK